MFAALVLALALQQDSTVLDIPTYTSTEWGVSMPRPFDDWIFAPATARGTTTVIFQPRAGSLSDQLWGALVLSSWGRIVPLGEVADRRITTTWRSTLGASFRLLTRDSLEVAGLPAIHIVMTGLINRAALDVEEYLVARDSELIALQFRYPRGQPRDSIAAGYLKSLAGLRVRARSRAPARRAEVVWDVAIDRGLVFFDLPQEYRAIAPGWLSSEVTVGGRRMMRWTPTIGPPDTSLYAIGRFRSESRQVGRLTVRLWRNVSPDSALTHVTDDMIAQVAEAWAVYWLDFGPVPTAEVALIETAWPVSRGAPAAIFIGADVRTAEAAPFILRRELARSWWGGVVRAEGPATALVSDALPAWSASLVVPGATPAGDASSGGAAAAAVARARRAAGEARFREAIRALIVESRGGAPALDAFLSQIGEQAAAELRNGIREQNH